MAETCGGSGSEAAPGSQVPQAFALCLRLARIRRQVSGRRDAVSVPHLRPLLPCFPDVLSGWPGRVFPPCAAKAGDRGSLSVRKSLKVKTPEGKGQALLCPTSALAQACPPTYALQAQVPSVLPVTCHLRRRDPGLRHLQEASAGPQREESPGNISKAGRGCRGAGPALLSRRGHGRKGRVTSAPASQQDPAMLPRRSVSPGLPGA